MRVLVTGAGGFTGGYVTRRLVEAGFEVRGSVRNSSAEKLVADLGAEPVFADLNDPESLKRAVAGVERVYHIAALFRQAGLPSSEFNRVNVEGTKNLLDASVAAGVKRFVHCSTVGVHGDVGDQPVSETAPFAPGDPYQESKVEAEKLAVDYFKRGVICGSVIRPAMIYGPGDTRLLKLFKMIASGKFFYVGRGDSMVHFVDVRDLANAFHMLGEREDINGEVFIIAGESASPLYRMVNIVADLLGVRHPSIHLPVKPMQLLGTVCELVCTPLGINPPIFRRRVDFFTKNRQFDTTKARTVLGFQPAKPLVEEMIEIINDYIVNGQIDGSLLKKPSAIVRDFDGKIRTWDNAANSIYGWSAQQAVGSSAHSLLRTEFPRSLEEINQELQRSGKWDGALVHQDQQGRKLEVQSTWRLIDASPRGAMVLELNRIRPGTRGDRGVISSAAMGLLSSFEHSISLV